MGYCDVVMWSRISKLANVVNWLLFRTSYNLVVFYVGEMVGLSNSDVN